MATRRTLVPIPLLIVAALLLILGVVANMVIRTVATPQQLTQNVLLSATPFILIFVAIVLAFIALVIVVSRLLNGKIAPRPHRLVEMVTIIGIFVGIFGIFQQWALRFYAGGFMLLLASTLAFILWSHIQPKRVRLHEE